MTAHRLADATAELGYPVPRSVIANLESGRRDSVAVAELLVLARALGVPPLTLVFPLGQEQEMEVLPRTVVPTWQAAKWFTGEESFPGSNEDVDESPTAYFREQDRLFSEWNRRRQDLAKAIAEFVQHPGRPDLEHMEQGKVDYFEDQLRSAEDEIRLYRASVRRHGVDLGALPPELAHVEQRGGSDGQR
jgi:transcriptional regulator with XRE-family HTH domain